MLINTFVDKLYRMKHMGEILRTAIDKSGMEITEVAKRFGVHRSTMYLYFDRVNIALEDMMKFGKIINHDFSEELPEMKKLARMYIASIDPSMTLAEGIEDYKSIIKELEKCREEKELLKKEKEALKDELLQMHREQKLLISKISPNNSDSKQVPPL